MAVKKPVKVRDWTVGDVARSLRVCCRTVSKWSDKGLLKGYRIPGGGLHRRFRPADVLAFVKRAEMPVPPDLVAAVEAARVAQAEVAG